MGLSYRHSANWLTPSDAKLLKLFFDNPGRLFSKSDIDEKFPGVPTGTTGASLPTLVQRGHIVTYSYHGTRVWGLSPLQPVVPWTRMMTVEGPEH